MEYCSDKASTFSSVTSSSISGLADNNTDEVGVMALIVVILLVAPPGGSYVLRYV